MGENTEEMYDNETDVQKENSTDGRIKETETAEKTEAKAENNIPAWKQFFLIFPTISRSSYIMRAVAGGYVAYLGISNLSNLSNTESGNPFLVGALSLFILFCGAHLCFSGCYALIKGEYK